MSKQNEEQLIKVEEAQCQKEKSLKDLEKGRCALKQHLADTSVSTGQVRSKLDTLISENSELARQLPQANAAKKSVQDEIKQLMSIESDNRKELECRLDSLELQKSNMTELDNIVQEKKSLKLAVDKAQRQKEELREESEKERQQLGQHLAEMLHKFSASESESAKLRRQLEQASLDRENDNQQLSLKLENQKVLKSKLEALELEKMQLQDDLIHARQRSVEQKSRGDQVLRQKDKLIKETKEERCELKQQWTEVRSALDALKREKAELERQLGHAIIDKEDTKRQ
jgi:chromosome segregation ATPase